MAYLAYNGWHENEERTQAELEHENLPNFNYTTDHLFFIEYAQYWCADTYEPIKSYIAASDEHSPDEFGTFVPLTNLHEFSRVFQCPLGSVMNPVKNLAYTNYCEHSFL